MSSPDELFTPPVAPKRPYVAPVLVVHGDVQSLTQNQAGLPEDLFVASVVYYIGQ